MKENNLYGDISKKFVAMSYFTILQTYLYNVAMTIITKTIKVKNNCHQNCVELIGQAKLD